MTRWFYADYEKMVLERECDCDLADHSYCEAAIVCKSWRDNMHTIFHQPERLNPETSFEDAIVRSAEETGRDTQK